MQVDEDETDYRMEVDVSYYYPRAISVYTYKNILITHGYYLKDSDWWCDSDRRYIHAYTLPSNTIINTLEVDIKNDGILCISAKKDTRRNHILTIVLDNFYREKPIQYPDTHCSLLTASFHVFLLLLELSNMIWPFWIIYYLYIIYKIIKL